jgi:hypothetical protein
MMTSNDERRRRRTALALLLAWGSFVFGCGSDSPAAKPPGSTPGSIVSDLADAPDWVLHGCAASADPNRPILCGVGSMGHTRNVLRARATAIGRARTEIARSLQTRLTAMLRDYQATAGDDLDASDEQRVIDVSKQITQLSLSGSEVRETWESPGGTVFALVTLELKKFEASLAEMSQLSPDVRQAVRERARDAFTSTFTR